VIPARSGTVVHRAVPAHLACRVGARARAGERNAWPAVVAIALGFFALVFSEVIPVGLLGDISGRAGHRGDARGPRRAGRVLGVRGRGRDHLGKRAGPGTAMAVVSAGIFIATVASLPAAR
jgi:hypothetical protein